MRIREYQDKASAVVGVTMEALSAFNLPDALSNTIRRVLWGELDKQFKQQDEVSSDDDENRYNR